MTTTTIATLPRSIYIEPTSRCNELCQQCPRTLLSREDDRDLSFDNFRYIVDQFPLLDRVVLHGLGEPLPLLDEAPVWASLGRTEAQRQACWRRWLHTPMGEKELAAVRRAVTTGRPYGAAAWVEETAAALGLDLAPRRRGRPPKRVEK